MLKDKKFYGVMHDGKYSIPMCINADIKEAESFLDAKFNILVEIKITRVWKIGGLEEVECE